MFLSNPRNIQTILFDFHGVLCFYEVYKPMLELEYPEKLEWISKNVFEEDKGLVRKWMRGEISSDEMNRNIAKRAGMDFDVLNKAFIESALNMKLDEKLLLFISKIREAGMKVGLVTDNMDVFSEITAPAHRLKEKFDAIVNSVDYGFLKKENHGKLFDIALEKLGGSIQNSLMVDNQPAVIELFESKGGIGYLYTDFPAFDAWATINI